jgi:hypothetical protein
MDIHNAFRAGKERFTPAPGVKLRTGKQAKGFDQMAYESVQEIGDGGMTLNQSPKHTLATFQGASKKKKLRYHKRDDVELASQRNSTTEASHPLTTNSSVKPEILTTGSFKSATEPVTEIKN